MKYMKASQSDRDQSYELICLYFMRNENEKELRVCVVDIVISIVHILWKLRKCFSLFPELCEYFIYRYVKKKVLL
jgi:hypothetical protein